MKSDKVAVLLHGPPCAGKTQVKLAISALAEPGVVRHLSLDEGWGVGQQRHSGGSQRYSDIVSTTESVLVIELGCGEPADLSFDGATRAAAEWVGILRKCGRTLHSFLLVVNPDDVLERLRKRYAADPDALFCIWQDFGLYGLYQQGDPIATFPPSTDILEQKISTSGRSINDVALEIMGKAGIRHHTA